MTLHRGLLIFIAPLVMTAYLLGLQGPLLFDDGPALTENSFVKIDGYEFDEWRTAALSSQSGPLQRPLAMFTFAGNHVVSGSFSPFSLKLVNLFIHLVIGALVYVFCLTILSAPALNGTPKERIRIVAVAAASLWLLHPLHVSTVLYAVQRMAQLSTLFVLVGLLVYARYRLRWVERGASVGEIMASALWLLLALVFAALSKENGLLLPLLIAVVEVSLFRGLWDGRVSVTLLVGAWTALVALFGSMAYLLFFPPDFLLSVYSGRDFSLEQRVMTQARLLWQYLAWLMFPDIRGMGFQHDDIPRSIGLLQPLSTLISILAWILVTLLAIFQRRRYPLLLFAVLFYLVGHSMESGLWPLEMVYEHRNYLPSIGIALIVASAISMQRSKLPLVRPGVVILCAVSTLFVLLSLRSLTWSSEISMTYANVVNHPDSPRANFFYGTALVEQHQQLLSEGGEEAELRELMLAAHAHFLQMHNRDPLDLSAVVMLQMIESGFFPGLESRGEDIEAVLGSRVMQSSDWAAFRALVDCGLETECGLTRQDFDNYFDILEARDPQGVKPKLERYRYYTGVNEAPARRQAILEEVLSLSPSDESALFYSLQEAHDSSDFATSYRLIIHWMKADTRRLRLPLIKSLFDDGAG